MFEVKVTVEIPGLPEAINSLARALSIGQTHVICNQNGANSQHIDNAGTVNINRGAVQRSVVPPSGTATEAVSTLTTAPAAPESGPATSTEASTITKDELGRAGAALIDAGKMPQLIALLGKYGVQAITQLKPEQYSTFADEMRALGAKF